MKKLVLLPLAALFVLAGCQDLRKEHVIPVEISGPSLSVAGGGAERSSVCVALDEELAELEAALDANPGDPEAQDAVVTYEARIADTCE